MKTSPLVGQGGLASEIVQRNIDSPSAEPAEFVNKWARGEVTLRDVKGYTPEHLFHIAQTGYTLYLNGKFKDAQVVFEGLVAVDPRNSYYYRALGVVLHRRGDAEGAIQQFSRAIKVSPRGVTAYVNRAEVHISRRDFRTALKDLDAAIRTARDTSDPIVRKANALRILLMRR